MILGYLFLVEKREFQSKHGKTSMNVSADR